MRPETQAWAGEFGTQYTDRQRPDNEIHNASFFARALARTEAPPRVALELGAGAGDNIRALHRLYPHMSAWAVEVNRHAASQITGARVLEADITEAAIPVECYPDLTFTKGVLIHIHPDDLHQAYLRLARSLRYVLIAEYYNPEPLEVMYRGRGGMLWKRDFAADFIAHAPAFRVVDYGFAWRYDAHLKQDDLTWFLFERRREADPPGAVRAAFDSILRGGEGGQ